MDLPVVPCSQSDYFDIDRVREEIGERYFGALYCLESYGEYTLEYAASSEESSSIQVTFEACQGDESCLELGEIEQQLEGREFWFPFE